MIQAGLVRGHFSFRNYSIGFYFFKKLFVVEFAAVSSLFRIGYHIGLLGVREVRFSLRQCHSLVAFFVLIIAGLF